MRVFFRMRPIEIATIRAQFILLMPLPVKWKLITNIRQISQGLISINLSFGATIYFYCGNEYCTAVTATLIVVGAALTIL